MQNRQLIWIAGVALGVAGVAAFINSRETAASLPSLVKPAESEARKKDFALVRSEPASIVLNDPAEAAVARVRELFAQDPNDSDGRAAQLLNDYCQAGEFEIALKLVDAVPADMRLDWTTIVFNRWAQRSPKEAMAALDTVVDPTLRDAAFVAAVSGWNSNDPAGLADYAMHMPESNDRATAMLAAVNNWSMQDPAALADWLNHLPRGDEYDYGVSMMIAFSDRANHSPQVAMQWVENINDPIYKQNSFQRILAEWLQTDSAAARQYVATATWLDDSARAKILNGL